MILGIDQGITNIAYSLLDYDQILIFTEYQKTKSKDDYNKLKEIKEKVEDILNKYDIDIIVCEVIYQNFGRGNGGMRANLTTGLLYAVSIDKKIELIQIPPATVKKVVAGSCKAKKDAVIEEINKIYKENIKNNHCADAVAIALTYIKQKKQSIAEKEHFIRKEV